MSGHTLCLDLETTGLNEDKPSIIEIGCVHYNGEERLSDFNIKFQPKPGKGISLGALKVNKATLEKLASYPTYEEGLKAFVSYLTDHIFPAVGNKKLKITGQNVGFDIQLLRAALEELGFCGWQYIFDHSINDTSVLGNALRDAGILEFDKMSLENLAVVLGISVNKELLHTALYDAELSGLVHFAILKLLRALKNGKKNS